MEKFTQNFLLGGCGRGTCARNMRVPRNVVHMNHGDSRPVVGVDRAEGGGVSGTGYGGDIGSGETGESL